jgi:hypothetical protein
MWWGMWYDTMLSQWTALPWKKISPHNFTLGFCMLNFLIVGCPCCGVSNRLVQRSRVNLPKPKDPVSGWFLRVYSPREREDTWNTFYVCPLMRAQPELKRDTHETCSKYLPMSEELREDAIITSQWTCVAIHLQPKWMVCAFLPTLNYGSWLHFPSFSAFVSFFLVPRLHCITAVINFIIQYHDLSS